MHFMDFLVCDDIRHEMGNKFSLMGVFGGDITVSGVEPGKPFALRLGVFARVQLAEGEPYPELLKLIIRRGDEVLMSQASALPHGGEKRRILMAANIQQAFSDMGEHTFELWLEADGKTVGNCEQKIRIMMASAEAASNGT